MAAVTVASQQEMRAKPGGPAASRNTSVTSLECLADEIASSQFGAIFGMTS